ncbi:MAG: hypothetical protein HYZ53_14875 [Planctomycetes bacterium]|nr:hypothetical protein [Planctomycetota bacterium]
MPNPLPNPTQGSPGGGGVNGGQGKDNTLKWVLGCLAAVFVFGLLVCGGLFALGIWGAQKFKQWAEAMQQYGENIQGKGEVGKLYAEARTLAPYEKDAPPALTADRVSVFLAIRKDLRPELERHRALFQKLDAQRTKGNAQPGFDDVMRLLRAWNELKLAYARVLVRHAMSPEEFHRIATLVYATIVVSAQPLPEGLLGGVVPTAKETALLKARLQELSWEEWKGFEFFLFTSDVDRFKPKGQPFQGGTGRSPSVK